MTEHNNIFFEITEHTLLITTFVMVMMMLIEYVTVQTKGKWSLPIKKSPVIQVFFAAFLGIIPGCLGTFAAVSLYSHKILSFAALVTVMIATSGDEAFIMFSMMPKTAVIISISIFAISFNEMLTMDFILNEHLCLIY